MIEKIKNIVKESPYVINKKIEKLEKMFQDGLFTTFKPSLYYLITGKLDSETQNLVEKIEAIRAEIASHGDQQVPIWYSPKPGSSGNEVSENLNPKPGDVLEFTMKQVANTGKDQRWGTFMHLLLKSFKSKNVLELGSCAGISACYLSSTGFIENFITVEGSTELSKIAKKSVNQINDKAIVWNNLFEEAIENDLPKLNLKLDCIYIDGHHEKIATIHYYEKLKPYLNPNAIVIFDDISWSYDMREAWDVLANKDDFSCSVDFGVIGVCIYGEGKSSQYWDLQSVLGKVKIGDPHGWKS